jgi:hypothetical protein
MRSLFWDLTQCRLVVCYWYFRMSYHQGSSSLLKLGPIKANSHTACHSHAVPLPCRAAKGLDCVFPIWFTQYTCVWFTHPMPCHDHAVLKATSQATAQRGMGMAWHVWISTGRPEAAYGRPAHVRLLPATTRSSTKVVIRSIKIH